MSYSLGLTRPRRVANRFFANGTNISLATTRAAQKSGVGLFEAGKLKE